MRGMNLLSRDAGVSQLISSRGPQIEAERAGVGARKPLGELPIERA
jgi:hypothetical protein